MEVESSCVGGGGDWPVPSSLSIEVEKGSGFFVKFEEETDNDEEVLNSPSEDTELSSAMGTSPEAASPEEEADSTYSAMAGFAFVFFFGVWNQTSPFSSSEPSPPPPLQPSSSPLPRPSSQTIYNASPLRSYNVKNEEEACSYHKNYNP